MKRVRGFVLAAVLLTACGADGEAGADGELQITTAERVVEIDVEIADEPEERSRGLMGQRSLGEDAGMVFLQDAPSVSGFWMKDTLIPLSIAFWGPDGRIHTVLDMEPCRAEPCAEYYPREPWIGALEVNQGFFAERGIKVGDRARLER